MLNVYCRIAENTGWFRWMLNAISLTFALACVPTMCLALASDTDYATIDSYIMSEMDAGNIPGAAVVIVKGNQIVHLQSFGRAGTDHPITPQTPFEIGSCSKSFTALAIMQLYEQGKINLDAPVQKYLPWFRIADANASSRITIRHLLNHTSGLSTRHSNQQTMINPDGRTLEAQVRFMRNQKLIYPPGTMHQYSNLNYMTLALIIEAVSGQSYGEYLRKNIFEPLNMRNSFADPAEAHVHGFEAGYTWWFGFPVKSREGSRTDMLGAGYLMISAEDMSHWLIAQLNEGNYENVRVLSSQGIEMMHTPVSLPNEYSTYGMGWIRYSDNHRMVINHNGQSASYTCSMILLPAQKTGVAVMVNISSTLGPHAAWLLANNVKNMLVASKPAHMDSALRGFYWPWDIGLLLVFAFLLWSMLFDLPSWHRKMIKSPPSTKWATMRRSILPISLDIFLMLAAFFGLPLSVNYNIWRGMFVWQPDIVFWCLTMGFILMAKVILRIIFIVQHQNY